MSKPHDSGDHHDLADDEAAGDVALAVAGELAGGVCLQMVRPLRELREDLAVLVEMLDRHIGESKGPRGLSWKEVESLRQDLAECYLRCRDTARLASELALAVAGGGGVRGPVDVNKVVESALNLARHRMSEDTEVFVDLGSLPMVRAVERQLLLAVTRILWLTAESAAAGAGSAISIKTRREGDLALISIVDNGSGRPELLETTRQLASAVIAAVGGSVDGTSEPGTGSAFELRIPVAR